MTREEIHSNFISFMEHERQARGLTAAEMAELLGLSVSTYKNLVYHRTDTIDIEIACKLFELTHSWMWYMCGYDSSGFEVLDQYTKLPTSKQEFMQAMVKMVDKI